MKFILKFAFTILSLSLTNIFALGSDVTIGYSPASLRFGLADSLHLSDFDDVIATSLGYTPNSLSWPGLTITSAFKYPKAVVVFGVKDAGVPIKTEGWSYELNEDSSLSDSYDSVTSLIGARAQRAVYFKNINASLLAGSLSDAAPVPETKSLNKEDPATSYFLDQISALPTLADYVSVDSSVSDGGQDVIFVNVDSFAPLVKKYGADNAEILKEASSLLRTSLAEAIGRLRQLYEDRLVVFTVMTQDKTHSRRKRDAAPIAAFQDSDDTTESSYNLAAVYRDDFPVVFNIVLILTIILVVAVLFTSIAIAFMDPGRDSIIYRMTNPRMKKDQ